MTGHGLARRNEDGERGAVLVFAAVGLVVAIFAAAMAVDVGSVIWRKRDLQVVADLAATDAAQQLATLPGGPTEIFALQFAQESATRNGFDFAAVGNSLDAELGIFDATNGFQLSAAANATAVQVTATRLVDHTFRPGDSNTTVNTEAVASFVNQPLAQFSIGSKVASLTTGETVFDAILSKYLGIDPELGLDLVSYKGLADAHVTLGELAAEMRFGSVDELLTTEVTVQELAEATANILNDNGTADASGALVGGTLASFTADIDSSLKVVLSDIIDVQQGDEEAAASAMINVFDLLSSSGQRAQISNGSSALTVPLSVAIPNLVQTGPDLVTAMLELSLIEAPVISALGPAEIDPQTGLWKTRATTAQLDATVRTKIALVDELCVLNLLGVPICEPLTVELDLPIEIAGASATGSVTSIDCLLPESNSPVDVVVETSTTTASTNGKLTAKALGLLDVNASTVSNSKTLSGEPAPTLVFPGPGDPDPMVFPSVVQSAAASGLNLSTDLVAGMNLSVLGNHANVVQNLLLNVTDDIDAGLLGPVFEALGLSVGGADVRTLGVECVNAVSRLAR